MGETILKILVGVAFLGVAWIVALVMMGVRDLVGSFRAAFIFGAFTAIGAAMVTRAIGPTAYWAGFVMLGVYLTGEGIRFRFPPGMGGGGSSPGSGAGSSGAGGTGAGGSFGGGGASGRW